jgi:hypothetical protein
VQSGKVITYRAVVDGAGYQRADSVLIVAGQYSFPQLPVYASPFLLQAVPDPLLYPPAVATPTFYALEGMSHQWDTPGLTFSLQSACNGIQTRNISIIVPQSAAEPPGANTLKGQVRWAENKVAAEDPIPLIDIVVEKVPPGNSVFAFTETDVEGRYEFVDVPAVPQDGYYYRLYVSYPGIPMDDTYVIEITATDTVYENLDFIIDTVANLIFPVGNPNVGIGEVDAQSAPLLLMPNPMTDAMAVILPCDLNVGFRYRVTDALGRVKTTQSVLQGRGFVIKKDTLTSGVYLLEVMTESGQRMSARFVVE